MPTGGMLAKNLRRDAIVECRAKPMRRASCVNIHQSGLASRARGETPRWRGNAPLGIRHRAVLFRTTPWQAGRHGRIRGVVVADVAPPQTGIGAALRGTRFDCGQADRRLVQAIHSALMVPSWTASNSWTAFRPGRVAMFAAFQKAAHAVDMVCLIERIWAASWVGEAAKPPARPLALGCPSRERPMPGRPMRPVARCS